MEVKEMQDTGRTFFVFEAMTIKEDNIAVNAREGELCLSCLHKHYPLTECSYPGCFCGFEI